MTVPLHILSVNRTVTDRLDSVSAASKHYIRKLRYGIGFLAVGKPTINYIN